MAVTGKLVRQELLYGRLKAKSLQLALKVCLLMVFLALIVSSAVSWVLVHPTRHSLKTTPSAFGLNYQEAVFLSREDGLQLEGWLLPSGNSDRTVIIAHGYRNNRTQDDVPALSLAKELVGAGYNVLLFDFRHSGLSAGYITSIGQYEVRDLLGAVDFIRKSPALSRHIAVRGFSMGASTAILAAVQEPAVEAIIADSPFADLAALLAAKFRPFGPLILGEVRLLYGLRPWQVSPVKALKGSVVKPLLIIHGEADEVIPKWHGEEIYRAAGPGASLLLVPGAKHLKSYEKAGAAYSLKVIDFLNNNLN